MSRFQYFRQNPIWFNRYSELGQATADVLSPMSYLQPTGSLGSTQLNQSTASSACPSDDSGIERTLNLSPDSPFLEDTDSEDTQSFGGYDTRPSNIHYHIQKPPLLAGPNRHLNFTERTNPPSLIKDVHQTIDSMPINCKFKQQNDNRFHILSYEQVSNLNCVLSKELPIYSRHSGYPTIWVCLKDLFRVVLQNLKCAGIPIRDIRLNGGVASHVIGNESCPTYNDVDIIISIDLTSHSSTMQRVKSAVLDALVSFIPDADHTCCENPRTLATSTPTANILVPDERGTNQIHGLHRFSNSIETNLQKSVDDIRPISPHTLNQSILYPYRSYTISNGSQMNGTSVADNLSLRESYVYKQFRKFSQNDDCWSLLSLGLPSSKAKVIEFKFVDRMKRQFEFTVDSFQIILDSLLNFYETSLQPINSNFYPTVAVESVSGSFVEAFHHLKNKLIVTKEPEMIRGGGLLKYCRLLVSGYQSAQDVGEFSLEKYMSSRFFIDFQDVESQQAKLTAFLANHFKEDEINLKVEYLKILYDVVSSSTICLMSHEHHQTLNLICELLQSLMYRAQYSYSTAFNLDLFTDKQNLVLDRIYFGTQLFPIIRRADKPCPIASCCCCCCCCQRCCVTDNPQKQCNSNCTTTPIVAVSGENIHDKLDVLPYLDANDILPECVPIDDSITCEQAALLSHAHQVSPLTVEVSVEPELESIINDEPSYTDLMENSI